MKNNFISQNFLFLCFLTLSIFISISSNSMFGIWMGLEINMVSILPIFFMQENSKIDKSIMIYFLIQSISSMILMMAFMMMSVFLMNKNLFITMIITSIFLKMGFFPFQFWVPTVMEGLSWMSCFILLTIQKILPMMILFMITTQKTILIICMLNSILASIGGVTQFSLRKIMSFSSMNHLSMIVLTIFLSKMMFKVYLYIYTIMSMFSFIYFTKLNMNNLNQTFYSKKNYSYLNITPILIILNMAGTPPLLGFFPKMMVILKLLELNMLLISIVILTFNVLATFFYLRLTLSNFFMSMFTLKFFKKKKSHWVNIFSIFLILSPVVFFL
nr:NADH dehydrogenase subunit 2 [Aptinothrips stylifer]